jgi:hypothetical protein
MAADAGPIKAGLVPRSLISVHFRRKFAPNSIQVVRGWDELHFLGTAMEIVYPPRSERDCPDKNAHRDDDYMDHIRPLLEENVRHGTDRSRAGKTDHVFALREENARLRGLVVTLSNLILKSIAEQKS